MRPSGASNSSVSLLYVYFLVAVAGRRCTYSNPVYYTFSLSAHSRLWSVFYPLHSSRRARIHYAISLVLITWPAFLRRESLAPSVTSKKPVTIWPAEYREWAITSASGRGQASPSTKRGDRDSRIHRRAKSLEREGAPPPKSGHCGSRISAGLVPAPVRPPFEARVPLAQG